MDEELKKQQELDAANKAKENGGNGQDNGEDKGNGDDEDFDPFAIINNKKNSQENKQEDNKDKTEDKGNGEDKDKGTDKEDNKVNNDNGTQDWQTQYNADKTASRDVSKYVEEHPEFGEFKDGLVDLASKAIVAGHSKPLEFAIRNIKPPEFWAEFGRKQAQKAIGNAMQTRIGGTSNGNRGGGQVDYSAMSEKDFDNEMEKVLRG